MSQKRHTHIEPKANVKVETTILAMAEQHLEQDRYWIFKQNKKNQMASDNNEKTVKLNMEDENIPVFRSPQWHYSSNRDRMAFQQIY